MRSRMLLLSASIVMLVLLVIAVVWLFGSSGTPLVITRQLEYSTNPALDVRFAYDANLMRTPPQS